jgi:serine-type D-Ala-D-Ala endopeptidase (penicillin-binding protein 7)
MRFRSIAIIALACVITPVIAANKRDTVQRTVLATSYTVQDLDTGEILQSKNDTEVRSIASITKLMSAIVILDSFNDLTIPLTVKHINGISTKIPNGARVSVAELLHLSLMSSDNLAAKTLALNYPDGEDNHIRAMNAKAESLGMHNTSYTDPTGLFDTNVSTAQDLAKLIHHAASYAIIKSFSTSPSYTLKIPGKKRSRTVEFRPTNRLVLSNSDIIISKTGWIKKSGGCLVMLVEQQGRRLAVILLNSKNTQTRIRDGVLLYGLQ